MIEELYQTLPNFEQYNEILPGQGNFTKSNTLQTLTLQPSFKCKKASTVTKIFGARSPEEIEIFIVDPQMQTSYRINAAQVTGDLITVPANSRVANSFKVKTTLIKKRPDKTACKSYEDPDHFKDCVEKSARKKLIDTLGCIPPWMTRLKGTVCQTFCTSKHLLRALIWTPGTNQ